MEMDGHSKLPKIYHLWTISKLTVSRVGAEAWISLLRLTEPRAERKTVLKVKCFKEGSNGALSSWCKHKGGFH